jgi:hypothetical protein
MNITITNQGDILEAIENDLTLVERGVDIIDTQHGSTCIDHIILSSSDAVKAFSDEELRIIEFVDPCVESRK